MCAWPTASTRALKSAATAPISSAESTVTWHPSLHSATLPETTDCSIDVRTFRMAPASRVSRLPITRRARRALTAATSRPATMHRTRIRAEVATSGANPVATRT